MKGVLKSKLFLSLAAAASVMLASALAVAQFGSPAHAQAANPSQSAGQCSLATLKGIYVSNNDGFQVGVSPKGPFASAALYVFNGRGHADGITSKSINGKITRDLKFTEAYTLNPDCSGTETVTDSTGAVRHYDFYTSPSGSRFTFIRTDPGVVATGVAVRSGG